MRLLKSPHSNRHHLGCLCSVDVDTVMKAALGPVAPPSLVGYALPGSGDGVSPISALMQHPNRFCGLLG